MLSCEETDISFDQIRQKLLFKYQSCYIFYICHLIKWNFSSKIFKIFDVFDCLSQNVLISRLHDYQKLANISFFANIIISLWANMGQFSDKQSKYIKNSENVWNKSLFAKKKKNYI